MIRRTRVTETKEGQIEKLAFGLSPWHYFITFHFISYLFADDLHKDKTFYCQMGNFPVRHVETKMIKD